MSLNYRSCILSHTGSRRTENQDNFLFRGRYFRPLDCPETALMTATGSTELPLADFVLDGMGGENDGELASLCASEALAVFYTDFLDRLQKRPADWDLSVQELCDAVSLRVRDAGKARGSGVSGTTLSMCAMKGRRALFANVGDSPIWLWRNGVLHKMFTEHISHAGKVREGFTPKGALTQFIGVDMEGFVVTPATEETELYPGDRLLISSDGLGDMVSIPETEALLAAGEEADATAINLLSAAMESGGRDNITIWLCDLFEGGEPWPCEADVRFFKDQPEVEKTRYYFGKIVPEPVPSLFDDDDSAEVPIVEKAAFDEPSAADEPHEAAGVTVAAERSAPETPVPIKRIPADPGEEPRLVSSKQIPLRKTIIKLFYLFIALGFITVAVLLILLILRDVRGAVT